MRRYLAAAAISGLALVLTAPPAAAHGRGSDASNFESTITDDPALPGLEWQIINSDEYLQLTNTSGQEVAVPGYSGEPYLRIGPDGVYRNRNSQATYVNEDRFGETVVPADINPEGEPDWERISGGNRYAWHDHRIHWMAATDPPSVQTDPDSEHVVTEWTVPFEVDEQTYDLAGNLVWVPGGSPWIWLVPALLVLSAPIVWALRRTEPDLDAGTWRGLSTPAGVLVLLLAAANSINLIDDLFATPLPITDNLTAALQTAFFIGIGVFGGVQGMRGREGAFTAVGVGAGALFIGQGLLYVSVLSASQTASLFPGWLTRVVIAASLAQIIPLGAAAIIGTRRLLPEWDDQTDPAVTGTA